MRILSSAAALALLAFPAGLRAQDLVLEPSAIFEAADTIYTVGGPNHADTIATAVQTLRRSTRNGVEAWEMTYAHHGKAGSMADTTIFTAQTLMPVAQVRRAGEQSTHVTFEPGVVRVRREGFDPAGPVVRDVRLKDAVFAGSMMDIVYRALPLAAGYRTRVRFFFPERGVASGFDVEVVGMGQVEVRGAPVRAWQVRASTGSFTDTFWIGADNRALLKVESGDGTWFIR